MIRFPRVMRLQMLVACPGQKCGDMEMRGEVHQMNTYSTYCLRVQCRVYDDPTKSAIVSKRYCARFGIGPDITHFNIFNLKRPFLACQHSQPTNSFNGIRSTVFIIVHTCNALRAKLRFHGSHPPLLSSPPRIS